MKEESFREGNTLVKGEHHSVNVRCNVMLYRGGGRAPPFERINQLTS